MAFKTLYQFIKDKLPDPFAFYWRNYEQQKHPREWDNPIHLSFTLLFKSTDV